MAKGDIKNFGPTSVTASDFLNLQPDAGQEVVIHNILHDDQAILQFYDGSIVITIDTDTEGGAWSGQFFHCTNSKYYRVQNTSSSPQIIAADGIITKEA